MSEINALVLKQANRHAFVICELQTSATEELRKTNENMATLKSMMANMAKKKSYNKNKFKKTRFVEPDSESESKSESESEDEAPLPPTPQRKKGKKGKSKRATALSKTTSKRASNTNC